MITKNHLIILAALIEVILCGNILYLNGIASPSHHMWNRVLARGLAKKGFNVTMVSPDKDVDEKNIHYIHMEATYATLYGGENSNALLEMADQSIMTAIFGIYDFCDANCNGVLKSKGLDIILKYPDDFKFDLVINDFTCGSFLIPLLHKFKYPPMVAVTAFSNPPYSYHLTGGQKFPAIVPHYTTSFPQLMNYPQRLFNTILYAADAIVRQHISMPKMDKMIRERFNFKDLPSLAELEKKTALMLIGSENSIDNPEPLQPNVIQVAGLQITDPKELPQEMLKFVESSKRGTVLMSLGTNIKSNMLGKETLSNIIKTFAQMPDYNFIWKFESELHELPVKLTKNVLIAKFLPQNDILAHPRVKAFITHSGLLSTQEALWYGKPMVAIPFFCDQNRISEKLVQRGVGVVINFRTLSVAGFSKAIRTVLENSTYSENAQQISNLFRDKPQKPLDVAIWWIEYVIRNPSAPHYKSPSLKLGWFATNSYDVILTFLVVLHVMVFIVYKLFKCFKSGFKNAESNKQKQN